MNGPAGSSSACFDSLAREVLSRGSHLRFKARGESMHPFIKNGDILIIEPKAAAQLKIGDIVFFRRPVGTYTVHRLIKKEGKSDLITRGDNLSYYDEPVTVGDVLGKAIKIEGNDGKQMDLTGGGSRLFNWFMAQLARSRSKPFTRVRRNLSRSWWLLRGRWVR